MAARDKCLNILNFNTQKSFKVTSVSRTTFSSVMLYTKGEQSNEGGKGLTLLSAAFSGQESGWISLLNFDSSFPVARKVNTYNSRILCGQTGGTCYNLRRLDALLCWATLHDLFS